MNEVDITPILDYGLQIVAALLAVVGTYAVGKLSRWMGLKQDAEVRVYLEGAIQRAISYGLTQAREAGKDITTVDVKNEAVAEGARYLAATVPDALKRFGITPEKAATMLRARLE